LKLVVDADFDDLLGVPDCLAEWNEIDRGAVAWVSTTREGKIDSRVAKADEVVFHLGGPIVQECILEARADQKSGHRALAGRCDRAAPAETESGFLPCPFEPAPIRTQLAEDQQAIESIAETQRDGGVDGVLGSLQMGVPTLNKFVPGDEVGPRQLALEADDQLLDLIVASRLASGDDADVAAFAGEVRKIRMVNAAATVDGAP
jgi:hypothetical protein